MTTAKRLAKTLGGKWQYVGLATWECDDGKRTVRRCAAMLDEFENPCGPSQWWLYGDGEPRRAEEYVCRGVVFPPTEELCPDCGARMRLTCDERNEWSCYPCLDGSKEPRSNN